jgi:hypothetical protein
LHLRAVRGAAGADGAHCRTSRRETQSPVVL